MLKITDRIVIPYEEIRFITSRSSGPGGQHVNTADTRVTLLFNVKESGSLSDFQKKKVMDKLHGRINQLGVLQVTSQQFRSQKSNKDSAIERFIELMQWALKPVVPRKKTVVPRRTKLKRLDGKKRRGQKKHNRKRPDSSGEY
ncbi:MAG: aminoacyl-tRNA hydrolase [Pseudodesulfovibrio sp.]|nr:aminoacyl-tRNA hydrolase [Pseudodesulfovibrio sp.]